MPLTPYLLSAQETFTALPKICCSVRYMLLPSASCSDSFTEERTASLPCSRILSQRLSCVSLSPSAILSMPFCTASGCSLKGFCSSKRTSSSGISTLNSRPLFSARCSFLMSMFLKVVTLRLAFVASFLASSWCCFSTSATSLAVRRFPLAEGFTASIISVRTLADTSTVVSCAAISRIALMEMFGFFL